MVSRLKDPSRWNCTYRKQKGFTIYVGRTSTIASGNCRDAIKKRDLAHSANPRLTGFGAAKMNTERTGIDGYPATRGREQQLIDAVRIDPSLKSANLIRGVSKRNKLGCFYHLASNIAFGPLTAYTGNGSCP